MAHFHYVLFGGSVFGMFAGLYYWFPKMTGRLMSEASASSFWLMFVGFNMTFLVQHSMGLSGMPRRIYDYDEPLGVDVYNLISTIGSFILGIGVLVTVVNVLGASSAARRRATTRGRATRSSGSRPLRRRRTTSTWSRACAALSR